MSGKIKIKFFLWVHYYICDCTASIFFFWMEILIHLQWNKLNQTICSGTEGSKSFVCGLMTLSTNSSGGFNTISPTILILTSQNKEV